MLDHYKRNINYMRISITDRCNLRCRYCMPNGIEKVSMDNILSYEQITEACRAAVACGITRFKITGGEPLVRRGCANLVREIKNIPGTQNVTLTTNGVLLAQQMNALAEAGLDGANVSLDTLVREKYIAITGFDRLEDTLKGIDSAVDSGIRVKINSVLQKGYNEEELEDLIAFAKDRPVDVRFIEMMPIGKGKDFIPIYNDEVLDLIREAHPDVEDDNMVHGNGPAAYVHIPGWKGSIGFISAMHGKFCGTCNRIRLTSKGKIKPCLCFGDTIDIMEIFRETDSLKRERLLSEAFEKAIASKPEEHHFEHIDDITEMKRMIEIGG